MRNIVVSMLWLGLWTAVWLALWIIVSAIVWTLFFSHPSMQCGWSCLDYGFGFVFIVLPINGVISLVLTGYVYVWFDNRREKPKRKNKLSKPKNLEQHPL